MIWWNKGSPTATKQEKLVPYAVHISRIGTMYRGQILVVVLECKHRGKWMEAQILLANDNQKGGAFNSQFLWFYYIQFKPCLSTNIFCGYIPLTK